MMLPISDRRNGMKYGRYLILGILAIFLSGCGTTVSESLKVPFGSRNRIGSDKTVVILPFADYTHADNLESAYRRNLFISENLTDQFVKNSFHLPVQEDVFLYLINQHIINAAAYDKRKTKSVERELRNDWSDQMKDTLQHYIKLSQNMSGNSSSSQSLGTHGLSQQEIVKIGRHFSADYIVRGRIIQYKERQDPSWSPFKKGLIPFVAGVSNRVVFGQAASDDYDALDNAVAGGADGLIISGVFNNNYVDVISWGAVGAGLGVMAHNSGKIPQAVVQLRIWVQDAYTGSVVWTNRIDVKVSPESVLADFQYDALFEKATEKAIATLVDDFSKTL